jgi:hypothetical protein
MEMPFTTYESELFMDHLSKEKENGFARDILLMWNIQSAKFGEARELMTQEGFGDEKRRVIKEGLDKAKVSI